MNRRVLRKLPAGQQETYQYDGVGNLTAETDFNGKTTKYAYDALNRLKTVTGERLVAEGAASATTTYNYDGVGDVQNYMYPNGVQSAMTYDA